jgi:hypothetical protein
VASPASRRSPAKKVFRRLYRLLRAPWPNKTLPLHSFWDAEIPLEGGGVDRQVEQLAPVIPVSGLIRGHLVSAFRSLALASISRTSWLEVWPKSR